MFHLQDLEKISGPSDEMELVAQVNKKFKSIFLKQEEQCTFPTYDKLEVCRLAQILVVMLFSFLYFGYKI